jgi:hypothetical protein
MNMSRVFLAAAVAAAFNHAAQAEATPEEAKLLGTKLTHLGAEKDGNKEGTIPPYTGGMAADFVKFTPTKNGFRRPTDPYANEKPLFSITAENMTKYADKLDEGNKALLTRHPKSYRMDIYPTHRSVAYSQFVIDNTLKNALSAKTVNNGVGLVGAFGGLPFPLPKTGNEAMWNFILKPKGLLHVNQSTSWYVDSSGNRVMTSSGTGTTETVYQDPKTSRDAYLAQKSPLYVLTGSTYSGPARLVGNENIYNEFLGEEPTRRAWSYVQGQRRARVSPDLAYDTPVTQGGGVQTYDEVGVFWGKLDRFNYKLVGKKELYVPYNTYKQMFESNPEKLMMAKHVNPDVQRWELHRVWVVEATLKPEFRHVYSKRTYYFDEDWGVGLVVDYDNNGKLYRTIYGSVMPLPDIKQTYSSGNTAYDFSTGVYGISSTLGIGGLGLFTPEKGNGARYYTPEALLGRGVR